MVDDARFDSLARRCSELQSRRGFLGVLTVVVTVLAVSSDGRQGSAECIPSCDGRACGSDGCGRICGECPIGETCIPATGACEVDPPACSVRGESCHVEQPCCVGLLCEDDVCVERDCRPLGSPCDQFGPCCVGRVCLNGRCEASPADCVQTGEPCQAIECCEVEDTCSANPAGALICQSTAPAVTNCVHAGDRIESGDVCCPRLHREKDRCVVNRWDACTRGQGRRQPCERGTRCLGGRHTFSGNHVCVPAGRGRRHMIVFPWKAPLETEFQPDGSGGRLQL